MRRLLIGALAALVLGGAAAAQQVQTGVVSPGGTNGQVQINNSGVFGGTSNLSTSVLNSGTNADSSHFWRGDGTWAVPAGGGTPCVTTALSLQYDNAGAFGCVSGVTSNGTSLTFTNSDLLLLGSSTGATTFTSANAGASNFTITVPAVTDTLAVLATAQTFTAKNTDNQNGLGTAITDAWAFTNTTAAAAAAQQVSPALHFIGQGWKTTATAASQQVEMQAYLLPIQRTTNPGASLVLIPTINAVAGNGLAFCSEGSVAVAAGTFLVGLDGQAAYNCDSGAGFTGLGPNGGSNVFSVWNNSAATVNFSSNGALTAANKCWGIYSSNTLGANTTADTAICRSAAGVFEASTSGASPNSSGQFLASQLSTHGTIYSAAGTPVPTCNAGAEGEIVSVSDAGSIAFNHTYASGGSTHEHLGCDGTNWKDLGG